MHAGVLAGDRKQQRGLRAGELALASVLPPQFLRHDIAVFSLPACGLHQSMCRWGTRQGRPFHRAGCVRTLQGDPDGKAGDCLDKKGLNLLSLKDPAWQGSLTCVAGQCGYARAFDSPVCPGSGAGRGPILLEGRLFYRFPASLDRLYGVPVRKIVG